ETGRPWSRGAGRSRRSRRPRRLRSGARLRGGSRSPPPRAASGASRSLLAVAGVGAIGRLPCSLTGGIVLGASLTFEVLEPGGGSTRLRARLGFELSERTRQLLEILDRRQIVDRGEP